MEKINRIYTKGELEVQNITIGMAIYEYEYDCCCKSIVKTLPVRNEDGLWQWTSETENGEIINYAVHEKYSHYSPNLYDYEAYKGTTSL